VLYDQGSRKTKSAAYTATFATGPYTDSSGVSRGIRVRSRTVARKSRYRNILSGGWKVRFPAI